MPSFPIGSWFFFLFLIYKYSLYGKIISNAFKRSKDNKTRWPSNDLPGASYKTDGERSHKKSSHINPYKQVDKFQENPDAYFPVI